jgi:hypothetical protein
MVSRHLLIVQLVMPKDLCTLVLSHLRIGYPLTELYMPPHSTFKVYVNKLCNNYASYAKDFVDYIIFAVTVC